MAGPSLALGVNAAGKETLVGLNEQLALLRTNLSALKGSGKTDLSGLSSAAAEIKKLRADFVDSNAGLRTSFAELAEAIKGGLTKASTEAESSGKKLRSTVARERAQLQAEYEKMLADGRSFNNAELAAMKDAGVRLAAAQVAKLKATAVVSKDNKALLGGGSFSNPLPASAKDSEVEAAWAAHSKATADSVAAAKASAWVRAETSSNTQIAAAMLQADQGFAVIAKESAARRVASAEAAALAAARGIEAGERAATAQILADRKAADLRYAADLKASSELRQAAKLKTQQEDAAWSGRSAKSNISDAWDKVEKDRANQQVSSFKQANQGFRAIEMTAAAERVAAREAGLAAEVAGIKVADAAANAEMLRQVAIRKKAAKEYADATAEVAALRERDNKLDAAYAASNQRAQQRKLVGARAQLDAGLPVASVQASFGPQATGLAQAAGSLRALQTELTTATPRMRITTQALNDLHSAARGAASGFGAMFLTWGNIAPLLAGAALSNAFVQTVKIGADIGQTLETIRVLGGNTVGEIALLQQELMALGAAGPFGPREVAEAMKTLALAGLNAKDQLSAVKDVLNFAVAGDLPIAKAAESLVTISTAFGYSANDYGRVSDVIAKAAAISVASVESVAKSIAVATPLATQYGASLEDVATGIALLSNVGTRGTAAGTSERNFYSELLSTTPKVKKALAEMGFSALDSQQKIKGIVQISKELKAAVDKLSPQKKIEFIATITTERGNKTFSALLEGANKEIAVAQADGSKIIMSGVEFAHKQVMESYGFAATAAAYMSLTASNQIKSVFSSLQVALLAAFDGVEPAVLQVANTLRTAFNSQELQGLIQGLANTVANLTVALVDNAKVIGIAAAAWLVYKGAMVSFAVFTALSNSLTIVRTAMAEYAVVTAAAAATAPALAAGTAGVAVATTGLGTAFSFLRVAMGPIALLIGGITTAYLLYKAATAEAKVTAQSAADLSGGQLLENLRKETERIEQRNEAIRKGTSDRQADILAQQQQVKAELSALQIQGRKELEGKVTTAQKKLDDLPAPNIGGRAPALEAQRLRAAQELLDAKDALSARNQKDLQQTRDVEAAQAALSQASFDAEQLRLKKLAEEEAKNKKGTQSFGGGKDDKTALSGLKREFADEMALVTQRYGDEQKLLDLKNKNKLISDAAYAFQSDQIAEAQYREEMALLNKRITDSAGLIAKLRLKNDKGESKDGRANAEANELETKAEGYKNRLEFLKAEAKIKQEGSAKKVDDFFDKEIAKLDQTVALAKAQQQVAQDTANLTEKQVAYYTAENASLATTNDFLREKQKMLDTIQTDLAAAVAASADPTNDTYVKYLQGEVDKKQGQITAFTVARNKDAAALGQIAADNAQPNWQKMLEGFKNTVQQMESAYNEVVEGFVTKGQTIFADIFKTGKISLKSLLDLVQDVLVKQVYQTQIAPLFADMGKLVAGQIFPQGGKNPNYSNEGNNYKVNGIDTAASNTTSAFTALQTTGITPTITSFSSLVLALEAAAAAAYRLATSSGGGGGGSAIGQFFGGSSGAGTGGDGWTTNPQAGAAHGNIYGSSYRFAGGGAFTNSVVTERTPFHFKNGGKFSRGEMGEAGPEAIMPLRRGANGSLGVVAMGGGGGGSNTTVEVHNYGDGKARTQESKNPDGSKVVRVIIDQAKREVAGDIQRGGMIGDAVESQYGMNRANGLPRR